MAEKTVTYKHGEYSQEIIDLSGDMLEQELLKLRPEDTPYNSTYLIIEYCFRRFGVSHVERMYVIYFNNYYRVTCAKEVGTGTVNEATVFVREIVRDAVISHATRVVLVHNHPSGDLRFSPSDVKITQGICKALALIGVELVDHYLIAKRDYLSYKEVYGNP
jgi:DNA repair protein RadC